MTAHAFILVNAAFLRLHLQGQPCSPVPASSANQEAGPETGTVQATAQRPRCTTGGSIKEEKPDTAIRTISTTTYCLFTHQNTIQLLSGNFCNGELQRQRPHTRFHVKPWNQF